MCSFSLKSVVTITHAQNINYSKTRFGRYYPWADHVWWKSICRSSGGLSTNEEKKSIEWKRFIFLTDGPGDPEFPIDPRWPASPCIRQKLNNKQLLEVKCQQFVISGKIVWLYNHYFFSWIASISLGSYTACGTLKSEKTFHFKV